MVQKVTPKRLQRERRFEDALASFTEKYLASLEEGDRFLSAIYMDEIVQTVLESNPNERTENALRDKLHGFSARVHRELQDDYEEDIEIAVRKRFPERYAVEKGKSDNESA